MKRILQVVFLFFVFSLGIAQSSQFVGKRVSDYKASRKAFASYELFKPSGMTSKQAQYRIAARDAVALELNKVQLKELVAARPAALDITVPFRDGQLSLELIQNDIFGGDSNLTIQTDQGEYKGYKPGVYYQGIIKGDPTSVVAFSFFEDDVVGLASDLKIGNIVLGKAIDSEDFLIYSDGTLTGTNPFVCKVDELMENQNQNFSFDTARLNKKATMTENCVRVYYEIGNKPHKQNSSNITTTTNWITAIHNNIGTLYNNDGVKMTMHEIFIWTSADPYTGDYNENLAKFRATRTSFNGDLAHFVNYPTTTSVAYLNSLCSNAKYAYSGISMSYSNVPTYSWTIMAMTHEMGHSLGSPHTHACVWNDNNTPIDGCGASAGVSEGCDGPIPARGTIMSYCHLVGGVGVNLALGFGPQPGTLIRDMVDSKACLNTDCVTGCNPTVTGLQISNLTTNSVTATIVDNKGGTEWRYKIEKMNGTVVKSGTITNKVINIANLEPNTYYNIQVGINCGGLNSYAAKQLILTDANYCASNLNFTDTGGETGNYSNSETIIKTFMPANPDDKIVLTFSEFVTEAGGDVMRIYNGPTTTSPFFLHNGGVNISGTQDLGSFESTHASGALTIRFSSNSSVVDKGWIAKVECKNLGIAEVKTIKFSASPNANKDALNIRSTHRIEKLEVFDMNGKLIHTELGSASGDRNISMVKWPKGVYLVQAKIEGENLSSKFIK